jgi:hypothetical protein
MFMVGEATVVVVISSHHGWRRMRMVGETLNTSGRAWEEARTLSGMDDPQVVAAVKE